MKRRLGFGFGRLSCMAPRLSVTIGPGAALEGVEDAWSRPVEDAVRAGPVRRAARRARSTSPPLRLGPRSSFAPSRHVVSWFAVKHAAFIHSPSYRSITGQVHTYPPLAGRRCVLPRFSFPYGRCFSSCLPHRLPLAHAGLYVAEDRLFPTRRS